MAVGPEDPLARAVEAARAEKTPADWPEVAQSVRDRVARSIRPAARILVDADSADDGSRTWVSSRVVEDAVRRVLQGEATHAPSGLSVEVADDRLRAVRADLVVAYGTDINALASAVRREVTHVVDAILGADPDRTIDLRVVDVVDGDPRRV